MPGPGSSGLTLYAPLRLYARCPGSILPVVRVVVIAVIVTLVVVIIVLRLKIDLVQNDPEDSRAHVLQQLTCTSHNLTRTLARVHNEDHTVHHRRDQHAVG